MPTSIKDILLDPKWAAVILGTVTGFFAGLRAIWNIANTVQKIHLCIREHGDRIITITSDLTSMLTKLDTLESDVDALRAEVQIARKEAALAWARCPFIAQGHAEPPPGYSASPAHGGTPPGQGGTPPGQAKKGDKDG